MTKGSPDTPPSPPLQPIPHAQRAQKTHRAPRSLGPYTKGQWHPQVMSVDERGTQFKHPTWRMDHLGHEPRADDPSRRGARQHNVGDLRDRRLITAPPDAHGEPYDNRKVPLPTKKPKRASKRPRGIDIDRKLKVIKRYLLNDDQNPIDILKALKNRGMGATLPECCAAVASQVMKPYRIQGIQRFTSKDSDVLEVIFLPAVRRFATFLSLGFSLEAWKSKFSSAW